MISKNVKVHGVLLFVGLIYGATYSITKIAMPEYIGPFGFIFIRVIIATIAFWIIDFFFGTEKIKYGRDFLRLIACALFGVAINQLLFFKGLSMTSTISSSVIMTSNPIIVLIISYLVLHEPVTRPKIIGIALGLLGALLLIFRGEISWTEGSFLGDFLILLNATSFGVYLVLVKPLLTRYKALTIIKWVFLFGMFFVIPFGFREFQEVHWTILPVKAWLSIFYVIFLTTVVAYLLNIWPLKYVNPTVVSYYIYLQPLFATTIAIVFLDEIPDAKILLFALLIFTGVYLVSRKRSNI